MTRPSFQLLRNHIARLGWPSPRWTIGLWFGLWIVTAIYTWQAVRVIVIRSYSPLATVQSTYLTIMLWLPLLTLMIVAIWMDRIRRSEDFLMLRLTAANQHTIAEYYVLTMLYRLRLPFVIAFSLMPLLLAHILRFPHEWTYYRSGTRQEFFVWAGLLIYFMGLHMLAASAGVITGLRWKRPGTTTAVIVAMLLLISLGVRILVDLTIIEVSILRCGGNAIELSCMVANISGLLGHVLPLPMMLAPIVFSLVIVRIGWQREQYRGRWLEILVVTSLILGLLCFDILAHPTVTGMLIGAMRTPSNQQALWSLRVLRLTGYHRDQTMVNRYFRQAHLQSANFQQANLRSADFSFAILRNANLRDAKLSQADFHGADLENSDLTGVELHGVYLGEANLRGVKLDNAHFDAVTVLPDNVRWLPGMDMSIYTDPDHPNFWRGFGLRGQDLTGADFRGANLRGVNLEGANLEQADLSHAILNDAYIFGARLVGTRLDLANMTNVNLSHTDLSGATLIDTNLTNAYLNGVNLTASTVTCDQLMQAASVEGATMPNGYQIPNNGATWRSELEDWCATKHP